MHSQQHTQFLARILNRLSSILSSPPDVSTGGDAYLDAELPSGVLFTLRTQLLRSVRSLVWRCGRTWPQYSLKTMRSAVVPFFLLFLVPTAYAQELSVAQPPGVGIQHHWTSGEPKDFGLSIDQWKRYQDYMNRIGKYHYSHLDPVFVSGLIADSPKERMKIAILFAQQEHARNSELLQFNRFYVAAMQRLYSGEEMISTEHLRRQFGNDVLPNSDLEMPEAGDRVALFMELNCESCNDMYRGLRAAQSRWPAGVVIDMFFRDPAESLQIQQWAAHLQIAPSSIGQQVTLNQDDRSEVFGIGPFWPRAFLVRGQNILREIQP